MATAENMSPRRLRVFAFDPGTANQYQNRRIREITVVIPWEMDPLRINELCTGPIGEYLEVIDYDPASEAFYQAINLNDPEVLLNDGIEPSEENPKFHQQMVYAIAMYTIHNFERALGRVALWSDREHDDDGEYKESYVQRLRIYPHALREANAYYDAEKKALLFGYFSVGDHNRNLLPGSTIFTCLSQDIITHETCHALLDGLHPRFIEPSNSDQLALHEGFSDIVAILQHFSFRNVLMDQLSKSSGNLQQDNLLGALAQEFGQALGRGGALRNALGRYVDGVWTLTVPDAATLRSLQGVHERGSVLVAAVFNAFLQIYRDGSADLIRIATQGTGVLPEGALAPDLVSRLADEASTAASHVLKMCIRALDYCPPVDVDFGDYLRAIITADHDLYPEDERNYRRAIIESFTAWGIAPRDVTIVTEQSLLWPTLREVAQDQLDGSVDAFLGNLELAFLQPMLAMDLLRKSEHTDSAKEFIDKLTEDARRIAALLNDSSRKKKRKHTALEIDNILTRNLLELGLSADRQVEHAARRFYSRLFWGLIEYSNDFDNLAKLLGLSRSNTVPLSIERSKLTGNPEFHIETVRMANRVGSRGQIEREYVVEIIQARKGYFDSEVQKKIDLGTVRSKKPEQDFVYRTGCTLLIDARSFEIRRIIRTQYLSLIHI